MPNEEKSLHQQIEELNKTINEVKLVQNNLILITQKNFKVTMKKLDKINEYNQISDMTNQVFQTKITNIEEILNKMQKEIIA